MTKARITELKKNLSRYLQHVRDGGTVLVYDRNGAVAQIVPIPNAGHKAATGAERLARLERLGLIRRGTGDHPDWFGRRRPPRLRGSVLRDLLQERKEGW